MLDVAAGSGDQTLAVAQQVGAQGYVLATDLSPAIVALARDNAVRAGFTHVETRVADGEDLGVPEASFDAAVCRLGLMFFPIRCGACARFIARCGPAVASARWCSHALRRTRA